MCVYLRMPFCLCALMCVLHVCCSRTWLQQSPWLGVCKGNYTLTCTPVYAQHTRTHSTHTLYTHMQLNSSSCSTPPHHHTTSVIHPHQSSLVAGLTIKLIKHTHTIYILYSHTIYSLIDPAAPHHHTTSAIHPHQSSLVAGLTIKLIKHTHTQYIYIYTLYTHTKYKKYIFTHYIHTRSLLAPAAPHHHTTSAIHPHQSSLVAGLTIKLITHVVPILPATQLLSQQVRC